MGSTLRHSLYPEGSRGNTEGNERARRTKCRHRLRKTWSGTTSNFYFCIKLLVCVYTDLFCADGINISWIVIISLHLSDMSQDRHCFFLIPVSLVFLLLFKKKVFYLKRFLFKGEDPDSQEGVFKLFFCCCWDEVVICWLCHNLEDDWSRFL